jgi:small-conductance mechanosensitive channel
MQIENLQKTLTTDFPFLDRVIFHAGETAVTVGSVVAATVVLIFSWVLSKLVQRAITRALGSREGVREGGVRATRRLTHYSVMLVGALLAFRVVGIDLSTLFAAGAVFAVGLGFALQNITQNFVSGVILLVERSIKPGDVLEVDGRVVRAQRIGIRATIAKTLDDEEIIVPNSTLVQSSVKNYTLGDSVYRLRVSVGVTYSSDMNLVRKVLEETAASVQWRSQDRDPLVFLSEFGNSSVVWEVSVWMDNPWRMRRSKGLLQEAIWWAFQKHDITIAFPQLDVHFDREFVEHVGALRRAS